MRSIVWGNIFRSKIEGFFNIILKIRKGRSVMKKGFVLSICALFALVVFLSGCETVQKPMTKEAETEETAPGAVGGGAGMGGEAGTMGEAEDRAGMAVEAERAIRDVFFDYDRSAIRSDARRTLEANAEILKANKDMRILIEGHCDERGTVQYNMALGERRAEAAKKYLVNLGVSAARIDVTSYGKEKPFCREHNERCWQRNRRAHFVVK